MAAFDGLTLNLNMPGAVVLLREPARISWAESLGDGTSGKLATGSRAVLLEGLPDEPHQDLRRSAREAANRLLDLVAIRSAASLALADRSASHVTWRPSAAGSELLVSLDVQSSVRVQAGGSPVPYPVAWHPSMRYFRISQTTSDLFDAFRNIYLALESVLDHIEPVQTMANGRPERGGSVDTPCPPGSRRDAECHHSAPPSLRLPAAWHAEHRSCPGGQG